MSPAPLRRHQSLLSSLFLFFGIYFKRKKCEAYVAPFDVRFPNDENDKNPYTVVQPDICVVCDLSKLDERGCNGAPDLIVEILSPSTKEKDTNEKYLLYEEHSVKEYWIVEPENKTLDVFILNEEGKYLLQGKYTEDDTVSVGLFPELKVILNEVFEA